jgi:hypothetical protein
MIIVAAQFVLLEAATALMREKRAARTRAMSPAMDRLPLA